MRKTLRLLAGALWAASLSTAPAAVRYVPSGGTPNYPTIQAAITASVAGDVIRVQPGVYNESITFKNADMTLTSLNPGDSNIVQTTVIQGNGSNSVVRIVSGQTTNTVLTGFTIRGGGGSATAGADGGGIYCSQSSPSIIGNIIENNQMPFDVGGSTSTGGGISCWSGNPIIARNIIRDNSAGIGGGILSVSGRPRILDNWIYNNSSLAGGGAFTSDQGLFLNNTVVGNDPDNIYTGSTTLMANNIFAGASTAVIADVSSWDGDLAWFRYNDISVPAGGTEMEIFFVNGTNFAASVLSPAGTNGNISADPLFVDDEHFDLNLSVASPCINAGDLLGFRSTNEVDIAGGPRVFALRVDMGASEFHGARNYPPLANAGPDQSVRWNGTGAIVLNGSASVDPDGDPLIFSWLQTAGPPVELLITNSQAWFTPAGLAEYRFQLTVSDGVNDSTPDTVTVVVMNLPPIASAGLGQSLLVVPEELSLDGIHSMDPEGQPLVFHWRQTGGPACELISPESPRPLFRPAGPGAYEFELIVSDPFNSSPPERVTFYLGQVPPIANAGPTRYAGRNSVTLDGSGSFAPNSTAPLQYSWRQISGPPLIYTPTNIVNPLVRGIVQTTNVREALFELIVRAGGLTSAASTVKVVIVPAWNNTAVAQVNPPFNKDRPTIIAFRGGDCDSGGSLTFPSTWLALANVYSSSYTRDSNTTTADPRYFGYGDQMMVLLSLAAPDYDQPIQEIGISTGCMTVCDVAERFNVLYKDPRYQVNRITFLDTGCGRDYNANISNLKSNRMAGKMFWIDNYFSAAVFRKGTLNIQFPVPPAVHATPSEWYFPSWSIGTAYNTNLFNKGVYAGAFFSVVTPGKNYQLETGKSEYHFGWNPTTVAAFPLNQLVQMDPTISPARLPGVVTTTGPTNGTLAAPRKVFFSCPHVPNAVKYEILVGPDSRHVNHVAWDGTAPPTQPLAKLPFTRTWWTLRVTDAYGTTSWADPRFVLRDNDRDNLSDEAEWLTYHTDPDNADTDGDGHIDSQELIAGTNPFEPQFGFSLRFQALPGNQLRFSWYSDPGNSYDLEYSPSLTSPAWQRVRTFIAPGAALVQHTITVADPSGFYRVRGYPQ